MASLIPGYEYDIFISYRQKDNKREHWVTEFVNALKTELEAKFKEDVSVYFDENPHDGLLETHDVDDSLKTKLKCLVIIPIISQTYCDPKCFAWQHEFLAFKKLAAEDSLGLKIKLPGGNVGSRILPVRIHDLDSDDRQLLEEELGGVLRSVDFIYKATGVNRPLTPKDDELRTAGQILYRDQINKVGNASKEIITGLRISRGEVPGNLTVRSPTDPKPVEGTFWENLKRRNVIRIATAHAVASWVLIKIGDILFPLFHAPSWAPRAMLILLMTGFPVIFVRALMFEIRPSGLIRAHGILRDYAQFKKDGRSINRIIIFGLVLVICLLVVDRVRISNKGSRVFMGINPDKSVAVLPFENLSGDPGQEYFSDGISEQIQIALAQVEDLKVSARSSSFRFKGKSIDLREVGEKLNVSTVLEGSVRREDKRVHINAELISVKDGYSLWSEQFDRMATVNDLFAIQREIAAAIVQKLKVTLLQNEDQMMREGLTQSTEAYDAYLKGYYFWNARQLKESEKYFRQAIALDSSFASAYAALAETDKLFSFFQIEAPHQAMHKAQEAAEKALKLDSLLSTPYLTLAFKSTYYDWDREKARRYFLKALSMNPRYAPAHYFYGQYIHFYEKDVSKAILEMQKAVDLEPFGAIPYFSLGIAYMYEKKFDDALKAFQTGAELNKRLFLIPERTGHCYIHLNQMQRARESFELAHRLGSDIGAAYMVYFYVKEGSLEKARSLFQELHYRSKTEYVCGSSMAIAASFLGQKDLANQLLRKAIEERDPFLILIQGAYGRLPNDLLSDSRNVALIENNLPKQQ